MYNPYFVEQFPLEYWAIAGPDAIRRFDECKAYQLRFSWLHPGIVLGVVIGAMLGGDKKGFRKWSLGCLPREYEH